MPSFGIPISLFSSAETLQWHGLVQQRAQQFLGGGWVKVGADLGGGHLLDLLARRVVEPGGLVQFLNPVDGLSHHYNPCAAEQRRCAGP